MRTPAIVIAVLLWACAAAVPANAQDRPAPITVFTAKKAITMDPTRPHATAVAVRDGHILS